MGQEETTVVVWCDVYVRAAALDVDGIRRVEAALHAIDRRLGVVIGEHLILLTNEADERNAREYAKRLLTEAGRRAGVELDHAVIERVVPRRRDRTGRPRRVEAPPGRYHEVAVGERGRLRAMYGGPLGEWVVYRDGDRKTAVAGRDLLAVISELLELPHGRKAQWIYDAIEALAGRWTPLGVRYGCPCCDFLTLTKSPSGTHTICPVCGWEDDSAQFDNPDYPGGANRPSLNQARATFREIGASESRQLDRVRPPFRDERPY